MDLWKLKLIILSPEFSDAEVERLFMDWEVSSEEELVEALVCLTKNRPELYEILNDRFEQSRTARS